MFCNGDDTRVNMHLHLLIASSICRKMVQLANAKRNQSKQCRRRVATSKCLRFITHFRKENAENVESTVNFHKRPTNEPTQTTVLSIIVTTKRKIDNVNSNYFSLLIYDNDCFATVYNTIRETVCASSTVCCVREWTSVVLYFKCSLHYTHESNLNELKHPKWVTNNSLLNAHLNVLQHEENDCEML